MTPKKARGPQAAAAARDPRKLSQPARRLTFPTPAPSRIQAACPRRKLSFPAPLPVIDTYLADSLDMGVSP
jgi:hypothetical protein